MVIPDKRYCFDYFSPLSSTGSFLDAYEEKRVRPTTGQVFDYFSNSAKRFNRIAWSRDGLGGANGLLNSFHDAKNEYLKFKKSSEYIDVHCSRFTPASFRLVVSDLFNLGLINFEVIKFYETEGCEFYVTLAKTNKNSEYVNEQNRLSWLNEIRKEINQDNEK